MHLTLSVFIVLFHSIFAIQRHYTEDLEFVYIEPVPVEYSVNEQYVPDQGSSFRMEDMIKIESDDAGDQDLVNDNQTQIFMQTPQIKEKMENKKEVKQSSEFAKAFTQLRDDEDNRLNWKILSEAMTQMLSDVQSQRDVESSNFERKKELTEQLIKIHERAYNKQRNEIAKNQQQIDQYLLPYKLELTDTLQFKSELLKKQGEDLDINEQERATQKSNMKIEMDEISQAIDSIDEMIKIIEENMNSDSFIQLKQSLNPIHKKLEQIFEKRKDEKSLPCNEIVSSLKSLLEKDFKEKQVLKEMKDLLERLRGMTMDYRVELNGQDKKNQQLYEDRKKQLEGDKQNNKELYESKLEQLDQTQNQIDRLQSYQKERQGDYDYTSEAKDRIMNLWTTNIGIQQRLENQLRARAIGIDEAIKSLGNGIEFSGEKVE